MALQVGKNTLGISGNTKRLDDLEAPIDLEPLSDAISLNAMGISSNAADIRKLQTTDAKQAGEIGSLQQDVVSLRGDVDELDISDVAFHNVDNQFTVAQTIQEGVNLKGKTAAFTADTGTCFTFDCNNAINKVVSILKAGGNEAISLAASGHISGVKTDGEDPTSAVSVQFLEDNGLGSNEHLHDIYATKLELSSEERERILGDQALQKEIDKLEAYDDSRLKYLIQTEEDSRKAADTSLSKKIATEEQSRKAADKELQDAIDSLEIPGVDPALYATVVAMNAGDAATLAAANAYTDAIAIPEVDLDGYATEEYVTNAIDAIEFPELPEDIATESYVADAVDAQAQVQANIDRLQQQEIEINSGKIDGLASEEYVDEKYEKHDELINDGLSKQDTLEHKVKALEGAVGEHALTMTLLNSNPRDGEFNLKDGSLQLTDSLSGADFITLSRKDKNGHSIDLDRITTGDVLRLSDSFGYSAELKITDSNDGVCAYRKLGGDLDDLASGGEQHEHTYDFVLLSSFDPEGLATIDYVDAQDKTKLGNSGEQVLRSSNWKVRAPKSEEGESGNLSFIDIKDDLLHLYHLADPKDPRHPAPLEYLQKNYADKNAKNEFTDTNTFKGLTYFESSIIAKSDTFLELKGDANSVQNRFLKVRGNAQFSVYCYPGDNNDNARNAFSVLMKPGDTYPTTKINYLEDPVSNGEPVTLRYLNAELKKFSGGSFAEKGPTTPDLATGQLFFNTTDKVLYIGE